VKPKVAVTRQVYDEVIALLSRTFEVDANPTDAALTPDALAERLADKDGAITMLTDRVDEPLLARCPKLRAVCNVAVGYDNIDVAACTARGVMVTNTPGVLTETTADFAFALMLAAARRITEAEASLRAGEWQRWRLDQFAGVDVHGATLGIVGMGRIGQAVARRARGFGMKVLYCNRQRLDAATEHECSARHVGQDDLLAASDFVVLLLPFGPSTRHLIDARALARMKRSAVLVNAARGGVVDDAALVEALRAGTIAAAGLDVFEDEPKLHPGFLALRNVVLTPHIASSSRATRLAMAMTAAKNLVAALTAGAPPNLVNAGCRTRSPA
jgi:glyoxylate/hydroxypyruvate/2-ketogluconate reductase